MAVISMKALLETGVHFGHRTRKWNPHMKNYIFTERNGIHIIDLQQTLEGVEESYAVVRDAVAKGGTMLFVGTKRQAQETIQLEAERSGMPYVNARWLGGTLTNWQTIRSRIDELKNLERRRDEGEFELLPKKEALLLNRKIDKLEGRLGGIRDMKGLPQLLFVIDVRREETAVHEANLLEIPVVAMVDTNCEPANIDYVIPSNDDAIRAIKLLTSTMADAVLEGIDLRKDMEQEEAEVAAEEDRAAEFVDMPDEELLGEATLAKLQSGEYDERDLAHEGEDDEPEGEAEDEEAESEQEEADEGEGKSEEQSVDESETEGSDEAEDDAEADAAADEMEVEDEEEEEETDK